MLIIHPFPIAYSFGKDVGLAAGRDLARTMVVIVNKRDGNTRLTAKFAEAANMLMLMLLFDVIHFSSSRLWE
jgi:hypothetical protein